MGLWPAQRPRMGRVLCCDEHIGRLGLVDIKDIYWLHDERVLIFVVESLDRTHSLFRSEGLTAKKVGGHMPTGQPIMVKGPQQSATYGGDQCLRN